MSGEVQRLRPAQRLVRCLSAPVGDELVDQKDGRNGPVRANLYSFVGAHVDLARGHGVVEILADFVGTEIEGIDPVAPVQTLVGAGDRGYSARPSRSSCRPFRSRRMQM